MLSVYLLRLRSEWRWTGAEDGSHSGLVRTLGKRVWVKPPGVRISYHPQF